MPWKDWTMMLQREEFVRLAQGKEVNLSSLCRRFGISRKSGYKWMERFAAGGVEGLSDRSRRPHRSPSRSDDEMERRVLLARQKHPAWGGRKLRRLLLNEGSDPSDRGSSTQHDRSDPVTAWPDRCGGVCEASGIRAF